ncbi:hypothetical protein ElyMa_002533600 [Elysia marginata]|uniref:SUEL-type lectin domain-containing protein n=1 Tax=Elysia marginata TaxID=1093978 RepID=A0AAV4GTK1_9GAST|nr:hypothetical protein ElyMa_002533600 [Elysia marginata]
MADLSGRRVFIAIFTFVALLAIAYYVFFSNKYDRKSGSFESNTVLDGNSLLFSCTGEAVPKVTKATYGPLKPTPQCTAVDVTNAMQTWAKSSAPGKAFYVGPHMFPTAPQCPGSTRTLSFSYTCVPPKILTRIVPRKEA